MGSEAKFLWVIMVIVKTIASFGPPISQLTEVISSHSSTPLNPNCLHPRWHACEAAGSSQIIHILGFSMNFAPSSRVPAFMESPVSIKMATWITWMIGSGILEGESLIKCSCPRCESGWVCHLLVASSLRRPVDICRCWDRLRIESDELRHAPSSQCAENRWFFLVFFLREKKSRLAPCSTPNQ